MDERRKEPRYLVREDVVVWDLHRMNAGCHPATIVDISRKGMRLEMADKLTQSSHIAIDFRGMIICGTVQYSTAAGSRFAAGIRIRDVIDPLGEQPVSYSAGADAHLAADVEANAVLV